MKSAVNHTTFSFSGIDTNYWGKFHILLKMVLQDAAVIGVKEVHTGSESKVTYRVTERPASLTSSGSLVTRDSTLEPFVFGTDPNAGDHIRIVPDSSAQLLSGVDNDAIIVMAWLLILLDDYPERVQITSTAPLYLWKRAQRLAMESGYTNVSLPVDAFPPRDVALINPPDSLDFRA